MAPPLVHTPLNTRVLDDNVFGVDLWYPKLPHQIKHIEVGLVDVRAADAIRISYDFTRDGYIIKQAAIFEWDENDNVRDADWQEVTFIPAWNREKVPSQ